MNYMYAVIWLVAGLILILQLSKENKIFYVAGGYFIVLGAWWLVDAIQPAWAVFEGVPGIVLKVITALALVILGAQFLKLNRSGRKKEKEESKKKD